MYMFTYQNGEVVFDMFKMKQHIARRRFRGKNSRPPKVTGRFNNLKVERHNTFCTLSNANKLGTNMICPVCFNALI